MWAATSPQLDGLGGVYCEDCDIAVDSEGRFRVGVAEWATDPQQAAQALDAVRRADRERPACVLTTGGC